VIFSGENQKSLRPPILVQNRITLHFGGLQLAFRPLRVGPLRSDRTGPLLATFTHRDSAAYFVAVEPGAAGLVRLRKE